jgi:hypothetical protein
MAKDNLNILLELFGMWARIESVKLLWAQMNWFLGAGTVPDVSNAETKGLPIMMRGCVVP